MFVQLVSSFIYLVYILLKLVILIYTIDKYLEVILNFRLELCSDNSLKNLIA
jgi:hypothetical protein